MTENSIPSEEELIGSVSKTKTTLEQIRREPLQQKALSVFLPGWEKHPLDIPDTKTIFKRTNQVIIVDFPVKSVAYLYDLDKVEKKGLCGYVVLQNVGSVSFNFEEKEGKNIIFEGANGKMEIVNGSSVSFIEKKPLASRIGEVIFGRKK